MDAVALIAQARAAGLVLEVRAGELRIEGPRRHEALAQALLAEADAVREVLAREAHEAAVTRMRVAYAGLPPADRERFRQEVADGDPLAKLVMAMLAEGQA
jgi:hypothetical protein